MSVRRILAKTIDTDLEYEAIGIDLPVFSNDLVVNLI